MAVSVCSHAVSCAGHTVFCRVVAVAVQRTGNLLSAVWSHNPYNYINARTTELPADAGVGSFFVARINRNRFEKEILPQNFCMPHDRWDAEDQ